MGQQPPPDEFPTTQIAIPKPDTVEIIAGDQVSKEAGFINPTTFRIKCGSLDAGSLTGVALPQERITQSKFPDQKGQTDGKWTPTTAGNQTFFLSGGGTAITDNKIYADLKVWPLIQTPAQNGGQPVLFAKCKQELRVLINDPCGGPQIECPLGTYMVYFYKDDIDTYYIRHIKK